MILFHNKNVILYYLHEEKVKLYHDSDIHLNKTFNNKEEEKKEKIKFLWKKLKKTKLIYILPTIL